MARVCDLPAIVPTLRGKVEFEVERGGPRGRGARAPAAPRDRRDLPAPPRRRRPDRRCIERFDEGARRRERRPGAGPAAARAGRPVPGAGARCMDRLGIDEGAETPELAAAALEFALEGLFLNRRHQQGRQRDRRRRLRDRADRRCAAAATGTAAGTTGPTRSRRRTTCGGRSTGSATTCSPARTPRDALRRLLRRGTGDGPRGLDEMLRRVREQRRRLRERGRLDGTLEEVRRLLDTAVGQERATLFPDPSDDARFREATLDALPARPGARGPPARRTTTGAPPRPRRPSSRSRTCCAARCWTRSSAA